LTLGTLILPASYKAFSSLARALDLCGLCLAKTFTGSCVGTTRC